MTDEEALNRYLNNPTISVPEAGRVLGIGRSAAYEAAKIGEIPIIKLGKLLRVPTIPLARMLGMEDYQS